MRRFPDYLVEYLTGSISGSILPDASGASLFLSNTTIGSAATAGSTVGTLSVSGGSTRAYTFSVTSPTSLFTSSGALVITNNTSAYSVTSVSLTARASDTGTSVVTGSFTITIISTAAAAIPSMAFNVTTNSQYIPLLGGIG